MQNAADFLFAFVDTPTLTDGERGLMREIAHRVATGTHYDWDPRQKDQVIQLFRKVAACFGLSCTL